MRDLRIGTPIITTKDQSTVQKGRVGLVSSFKRNPKNDAIEEFKVNFGTNDKGEPLVLDVEDLRTITRFTVEKPETEE